MSSVVVVMLVVMMCMNLFVTVFVVVMLVAIRIPSMVLSKSPRLEDLKTLQSTDKQVQADSNYQHTRSHTQPRIHLLSQDKLRCAKSQKSQSKDASCMGNRDRQPQK